MKIKNISSIILTTIILIFSNYRTIASNADSLHATHYEIHINDINFSTHVITGSTTVWLTPVNGAVPQIDLELISLTATAVWMDGVPVANFSQADSLVTVPLSDPLQPGDTASVRVDYNGVPFHESWGGFHFSGEYAFNLGVGISTIPHNLGKSWFPCVDNFTDRATYDVYCTLPDNKMAVCGGMLVEQVNNGNGTITWHWRLNETVPTYLASLAAGPYLPVSDTFQGQNGPVPIDIYVRPQDTGRVDGTFIHLKDILAIFENCMGPYSWERVGYTGTAIGSMEHAANIFIPHSFVSGTTSNEETIAHELSHMWMGDKVTCSTAQDMWINEGWATFFGMYYALALYGDETAYKTEMRAKLGGVLQYSHTSSGDGSWFPLNQIPQEHTYGTCAYDKGAVVCEAMRFYLGDSLFFGALKNFIDEFAFQPVSSYDMMNSFSEFTGTDMSGFFDNFIFHSGTPNYSIDSFRVVPDGRAYYVIIDARQKRHGPAFTGNDNLVEIMYMDQNWNKFIDTIHFDGERGHSVRISLFEPSIILVDPEERMCDATTDNYKVIKATGNYTFDKTFFSMEVSSIQDSAFIQVTHNWAPPDSLWEPVPGLRISDYRYWRIDGIVPEGFHAKGKFFYSVTGFLDNTLITSSSDTAIILYRKNASEDWQQIAFEKVGNWNIGNIYVENMQPGEYAMAVKEAAVGTSGHLLPPKARLQVFPNPSSGSYRISVNGDSNGELKIFSESGKLVKSFITDTGKAQFTWVPAGLSAGTYVVAFYQKSKAEPEIQKAIYLP